MGYNFSERFEIVYKKYCEQTEQLGIRPNETALARYLGVSKTTVQRWKSGQVPASKDVKTIHDKLAFSYDWLISGEGEPMDTNQEKIAALEEEVQRLRTRIFMEGDANEKSAANTGKAAGRE